MRVPHVKHRTAPHRTCRRHVGLVVEDPAKVILVRENFRLLRKKCSSAINHIDARQAVLPCDFLHAGGTPSFTQVSLVVGERRRAEEAFKKTRLLTGRCSHTDGQTDNLSSCEEQVVATTEETHMRMHRTLEHMDPETEHSHYILHRHPVKRHAYRTSEVPSLQGTTAVVVLCLYCGCVPVYVD